MAQSGPFKLKRWRRDYSAAQWVSSGILSRFYHFLKLLNLRNGDCEVRATGNPRFFRVRTIKGPTTIERSVALLGNCDVLTPDVRFFAEEFQPNGRIALSRGNKTLRVFAVPHFAELRADPWKAHESVVSAQARLREVESRRGWQWWAVYIGGGLGVRSIFYPNMNCALNAIDNALATNLWLSSDEPIRKQAIPGGSITLEARSLLQKYGRTQQFDGLLSIINRCRKVGHVIEAHVWHSSYLHVEILDPNPNLQYPDYARFGLSWDTATGRLMNKGLQFYRRGYKQLAALMHGAHAEYYGI